MCKNSCKVVFLDRDGTMNVEVNYLHRKEDLKLYRRGGPSPERGRI